MTLTGQCCKHKAIYMATTGDQTKLSQVKKGQEYALRLQLKAGETVFKRIEKRASKQDQ